MAAEIIRDPTEPEPMEIGEILVQEAPYLWHVELYLMSKFMPEMVEATIFKVRQAALTRAGLTKEDHIVHQSMESLQLAIESDLNQNARMIMDRSHHAGRRSETPGIGSAYQRELNEL
jgi:hypothetical protein